MVLGLGGNALTVSETLWHAMLTHASEPVLNDPVAMGAAFREVVKHRVVCGAEPLVVAVVHAFSSHNYELRYWLAASGIDPDRDIRIAIVPPHFMPDALASGRIDGFCVGEPWNSRAARTAGGRIILTKSAIWRQSPEKVLALHAGWADTSEERSQRLMMAMLEAAKWCGDPANSAQLAALMGRKDRLDVPIADLLPALEGSLLFADGSRKDVPDFMVLGRDQAHMPWSNHVLWYASQMVRWGHAQPTGASIERVMACHRPDLYRKASAALGWPYPTEDWKPAAGHGDTVETPGSQGLIRLKATCFFDGQPFYAQEFLEKYRTPR